MVSFFIAIFVLTKSNNIMARRFNIGDKVIKFKPSYYMNTFHKNHYVEYGIVTDADDDRFHYTRKTLFF